MKDCPPAITIIVHQCRDALKRIAFDTLSRPRPQLRPVISQWLRSPAASWSGIPSHSQRPCAKESIGAGADLGIRLRRGSELTARSRMKLRIISAIQRCSVCLLHRQGCPDLAARYRSRSTPQQRICKVLGNRKHATVRNVINQASLNGMYANASVSLRWQELSGGLSNADLPGHPG